MDSNVSSLSFMVENVVARHVAHQTEHKERKEKEKTGKAVKCNSLFTR